ncbi:MAG TPA: cell division protein CrgA [Streptosporangiaceae bacterium]|nr:cell division protein CrgA [Streptosporangiaceae bacterium]
MPKSTVRKKAVYTPPQKSQQIQASPRWLVPVMVGCWLIGLAWIATYYVMSSTGASFVPFSTLGNWNLGLGFGLIIAGVVLSTKWR